MKLIDKSALVAEIEKHFKYATNGIEYAQMGIDKGLEHYKEELAIWQHCQSMCHHILSFLDTLEVKEVDLELITGWFDHIAQIADDRMTLTNQRMTDAHALDEIKCIAKNSSEFITKHYKAQKGE